MRITKIMTFDAAHQLPNEECYGKCSNMHGHTYKLEVTVEGNITKKGWVINFKDLKNLMQKIVDKYDHSNLNDHEEFKINQIRTVTTAERIVIVIWDFLDIKLKKLGVRLAKVRLWETPNSYAELEV